MITGDIFRLRLAEITPASLAAIAYLILVGSLVGYTAYVWLLRVAPISLVSTYAFVNPVIAVILGWLVLAEPLEPRTMVAGAIIVRRRGRHRARPRRRVADGPCPRRSASRAERRRLDAAAARPARCRGVGRPRDAPGNDPLAPREPT